jgi:hypothetical protein
MSLDLPSLVRHENSFLTFKGQSLLLELQAKRAFVDGLFEARTQDLMHRYPATDEGMTDVLNFLRDRWASDQSHKNSLRAFVP